ncbi:hypothetical protein GRF29_103g843970 [Pseudopithomyces chartarum]|uniref:Uncharacterized protein n=1 Tax=Pseudopithomyces chartarum TaxID=1892770 RepID=A0AAN6REP5_9PLEO|nr:hypothetical protein GRF29_103g843970 [Pseudopithomyces chartarum]
MSSSTSPLPYGRHTTGSQVASDNASNIAGKIVLTTGVSPSGTGALFVETIAKYNPAFLILAGRSAAKVEATAAKIQSINPAVKTRVLILDLTSQSSVRRAAADVNSWTDVPHIDVLCNNAGIMAGPYRKTAEGIELQFGVNHIAHFLFTNLLISKILAAPKPRIVNISSDGHRLSGIRFDDHSFSDGKTYNQWIGYSQSKSANILFTKSLAEKLGSKGLWTFSVHPGVLMSTSLVGDLNEDDFKDLKQLDKAVGDPLGEEDVEFDVKTEDEMISTHVAAAFDPRLEAAEWNGVYLDDTNVAEEKLRPTVKGEGDGQRLWELSEKLVGEQFKY